MIPFPHLLLKVPTKQTPLHLITALLKLQMEVICPLLTIDLIVKVE